MDARSKVRVNTAPYEAAHGKVGGRSRWRFRVAGRPFVLNGPYSETVRYAKQQAVVMGVSEITVEP